MTYKKAEIMKRAWELRKMAKMLAQRNPDMEKSFADCLRQAWAEAKKAIEKATTISGWIVPQWLLHEKELIGIKGVTGFVADDKVEKESGKAFRYLGEWFPKSQCERGRQKIA